MRPVPANRELELLVDLIEARGSRIALEPLGERAVEELVDRLVAEGVTTEILTRTAQARGNPFFVIEILAEGLPVDSPSDISKDLRRTVLRRLAHLSNDVRGMLRVASLLGTSVDPAELAVLLSRSAVDLMPLVDEAIKGGVLDEEDGTLVFRHDIVREAVYGDMPAAVRMQSHREVARSLAAAGAPPRRVAIHFARAAVTGDGEAVSWLRRAAVEEVNRAPTAAADMLGQAAVLVDPTESIYDDIQAERVQALAWAGRVSEASTLATDVLSRLRDAELAAAVRASLGEALTFRGHLVEAGEQFELAARVSAHSLRALLLGEAAACRMISGAVPRAAELTTEALAELEATDDPRARSLAFGVNGMLSILRGDGTGLELTREAVRVADEDFLGESHRYLGRVFLGYALHETDQHAEALDVLREGLRLDEERGVSWARPCYHALLGLVHFRSGEWDDAVAELETAKSVCDDMDSTFMAPLAHGLLAQIALYKGDRRNAERELAEGESKIAVTGMQYGAEVLIQTRSEMAAEEGNIAVALDGLRAIWDVADSMGLRLLFGFTGLDYVRLSLVAGDEDGARRAVEIIEGLASSLEAPALRGTAVLCRGLLESDAAGLLRGLEILRESGRPLRVGAACVAVAEALAATDPARAREASDEAIAIYEGVGAQREVQRASAAIGETSGRRPAKRRAVTGWPSLSPTEHRVATLVAEGLSNAAVAERLVLSRRTVETHVYHVFQKLAVSSRAELAVRASREREASEVQ
jgi:DNA-binding CsgD family transcriptional regulator